MKIFTKESTLVSKHRHDRDKSLLSELFFFYLASYIELDVIKKFDANTFLYHSVPYYFFAISVNCFWHRGKFNKRFCSVYQQFLYVIQLLNDVNENMLYSVFEISLLRCAFVHLFLYVLNTPYLISSTARWSRSISLNSANDRISGGKVAIKISGRKSPTVQHASRVIRRNSFKCHDYRVTRAAIAVAQRSGTRYRGTSIYLPCISLSLLIVFQL